MFETNHVQVFPDGLRAISCGGTTIRVWSLPDGECRMDWEAHKFACSWVSLSPDGKTVWSGGNDKLLKRWDLESGDCLKTIEGGTRSKGDISPDGKMAATISDDRIKIWDTESGASLHLLPGHSNYGIFALRFAPDGRSLFSGGADKQVHQWDVRDGERIRSFENFQTGIVYALDVSADGKRLVTGAGSAGVHHTVQTWDVERGEYRATMHGHKDMISTLHLDPTGQYAITGGWDTNVMFWDLDARECLHKFEGHSKKVTHACFSPDARYVFSTSDDNTIRWWSLDWELMEK